MKNYYYLISLFALGLCINGNFYGNFILIFLCVLYYYMFFHNQWWIVFVILVLFNFHFLANKVNKPIAEVVKVVDIKQNYENELKSMNIETQKQNNKNKITILKENLTKANAEYKVLLSQKITEVSNSNNDNKDIIMNAYRELEQEKLLIIKSLEKNIEQLKYEKLEEKEHKLKTAIEYFTEIIESPKPSKAILSMVLDKIYIYNDKSIKIKLRIDIEHLLSNFDYVETA